MRLFTQGLHDPDRRPSAMEWERALAKTYDLLHPCPNSQCEEGWFVLYDENSPVCPYCQTGLRGEIVRFYLKSEVRGRPGQWIDDGIVDIVDGSKLYAWHLFSNVFADEKADTIVQATVCHRDGQWWLINNHIVAMMAEDGRTIPQGEKILLRDKMVLRLTRKDMSKVIIVSIKSLA